MNVLPGEDTAKGRKSSADPCWETERQMEPQGSSLQIQLCIIITWRPSWKYSCLVQPPEMLIELFWHVPWGLRVLKVTQVILIHRQFLRITFLKKGWIWVLVAQSCPTLWDPMNYSLPGSKARKLKWVAISFSKDWMQVSCITGRFFTTEPPGKPKERISHFKMGSIHQNVALNVNSNKAPFFYNITVCQRLVRRCKKNNSHHLVAIRVE